MLVEPDGSTRVVEYYADSVSGFNAKVKTIDAPKNVVHYDPTFVLGMGSGMGSSSSVSMGGSEENGGFSYSNQVLHH